MKGTEKAIDFKLGLRKTQLTVIEGNGPEVGVVSAGGILQQYNQSVEAQGK